MKKENPSSAKNPEQPISRKKAIRKAGKICSLRGSDHDEDAESCVQ